MGWDFLIGYLIGCFVGATALRNLIDGLKRNYKEVADNNADYNEVAKATPNTPRPPVPGNK